MSHANLVVDSSALSLLLFPDHRTASASAALQAAESRIAPDLLLQELASVGVKVARRGGAARSFAQTRQWVHVLIHRLDPTESYLDDAFQLALSHTFTLYDAVYLAVAERHGFVVLTADGRLTRNAEARGLGHLVSLIA